MRHVSIVLISLLAAVAVWYIGKDLAPPKEVRIAVGGQGGGYWTIAEKYAEMLRADGIQAELLETSGSVQNSALLASGQADVALLQGGIPVPTAAKSLGAIFYEPLLIFVRDGVDVPSNPALWEGLRIARGGQGSGTAAAFEMFAKSGGVNTAKSTLLDDGGRAAADAILLARADLAVFVAPITAPYLQPLFADTSLNLLKLDHLTAITRGMRQTEVLTIPSGGISLNPVRPTGDVPVVGMVAHLVADQEIHPSIVDRLVEAAKKIHNGADAITKSNEFPAANGGGYAFDPYAAKLLREGTSPLQAYLPYWIVAQIDRFAILLVPILIFLLPLFRIIPGVYVWRMRSRVFRYYSDIREIDLGVRQAETAKELGTLLGRLEEIDEVLSHLNLPPPYRDRAYTAHLHIDLIRQKIATKLGTSPQSVNAERVFSESL